MVTTVGGKQAPTKIIAMNILPTWPHDVINVLQNNSIYAGNIQEKYFISPFELAPCELHAYEHAA
jgi:hypothetical protein